MRRVLGEVLAPRLLPLHLLGLVATGIAVYLGFWQVDVWQAQRESAARDLTTLEPVALDEVIDGDDPFPSSAVGRPVDLAGSWLPEATFFAADRDLHGDEGYWAVTPVAVCDEGAACDESSALLVVRGWIPDPQTAPAPPEGRVELTGWLQPPEGSGVQDPDPTDDVLPEVRIADAIQRVDQDLYSAFLVADRAEPTDALAGLEVVTPGSLPSPSTDTGLRNFLYGIQWFVFAAFAIFIWWRWVRDEVERGRRAREAEAEAEQPAAAEGA
ncbi:MAG TPA: SURF1 family protein [Nocardioidaceae bacterium]